MKYVAVVNAGDDGVYVLGNERLLPPKQLGLPAPVQFFGTWQEGHAAAIEFCIERHLSGWFYFLDVESGEVSKTRYIDI